MFLDIIFMLKYKNLMINDKKVLTNIKLLIILFTKGVERYENEI
jgi:hypothetical protein